MVRARADRLRHRAAAQVSQVSPKSRASGHFIDIVVNNRLRPAPCAFRVRDTVNRVVIFETVVGISQRFSRRLNNVFSQYQMELFSCTPSVRAIIDND